MKNKSFNLIGNEKGVALIITFFIMIIILAVTLSISSILYSEIKILRNIGSSVVAFYAADSGIEKVLYYDRQVNTISGNSCSTTFDCDPSPTPLFICINSHCVDACILGRCDTVKGNGYMCKLNDVGEGGCVPRGLCSMFDSGHCEGSGSGDPAIYCMSSFLSPVLNNGCNLDNCVGCTITFNTDIDGDGKMEYSVEASVYQPTSPEEGSKYLDIKSRGDFGDAGRRINTYQQFQYPPP